LFVLAFSLLHAQTFYSTRPDYIRQKTEGNNLLKNPVAVYPDTTLYEFHNFFPRNFMGNVGLPSPNYIFNYGTDNLGFRLYPVPMANDLFREEQVNYCLSKGPYASLTGIAGSKRLQILKLFFTQTYKDKLNITLKFHRYSSQGFYLKQQTYTNNLFISSNYATQNKRSGYYFYFLTNSNKYQENGGITRKILTDSTLYENKEIIPVRLTNAVRDNKEYKAMINPWLRLNKWDSASTSGHYLQLKSKFNLNFYEYTDANPLSDKFYAIMYLDTVKTADSTRLMQITNSLDYSYVSERAAFSIGYKNEINQVTQKADSVFFSDLITADLVLKKVIDRSDSLQKRRITLESHFNAQYIFAGANTGNYKAENHSSITFNKKRTQKLWLNVLYEQRSPDYIYNYWVSNHFMWFNNGFKPQTTLQAKLGYNFNRSFGLSLIYQDITNYLFFDHVALPRQYAAPLQNLGVTANYNVVLFKHLGISLHDIVQNTSNTSYISVPSNIATAKLFFTGSFYKNNLQLQIGGQLQYYASFYPYAYMPATQSFYLQDQTTTGEYPFLDVFLNARIRPVNVFLKVENVLQKTQGNNYFFVPGYYQPDMAFRFGINWMFFD
jgi:hypothetical protein